MTQHRFQLESFEVASEVAPPFVTPADLEEARLSSFDKGYRAGWDDCNTTGESEESELKAAIGQNLQHISSHILQVSR